MTDELEYWKARAGALETATSDLRRRLLLLARVLPLDFLPYLEEDLDRLETELPATDLLDGWVETTALTPAGVKTELQLLWKRLALEDAPP